MTFSEQYVHQTGAASELGVTDRTLARWRAEGRGPAYTRIGHRIYYRRSALLEYAKAVEVVPVRTQAA